MYKPSQAVMLSEVGSNNKLDDFEHSTQLCDYFKTKSCFNIQGHTATVPHKMFKF